VEIQQGNADEGLMMDWSPDLLQDAAVLPEGHWEVILLAFLRKCNPTLIPSVLAKWQ
jgi:hypothetical protein